MSQDAFERALKIYEQRMDDEAAVAAGLTRAEFLERRDEFLLSVGPEVAQLLRDLIVGLDAKCIVELGTSYGYSTLFLADAARQTGGKLYTYDSVAGKQEYARTRIQEAGLSDSVEWRLGDAVELLGQQPVPVNFVLMDLWKELYVPCFERLHPMLSREGVIVADNMLYPESSREHARKYGAAVRAKADMEAILLPIGQGIDVSCKNG